MAKEDSSVYEYTAGYITLKAEGYLFVQMKENSFSTIATVEESHKIMAQLIPEGPVYILVDIGLGSDGEEGINEYMAQSFFGNRIKAQALVVHELATRLMGNLFLRYFKKKWQIKIFSKENDARVWLLDRMQNSERNGSDTKKMTFV